MTTAFHELSAKERAAAMLKIGVHAENAAADQDHQSWFAAVQGFGRLDSVGPYANAETAVSVGTAFLKRIAGQGNPFSRGIHNGIETQIVSTDDRVKAVRGFDMAQCAEARKLPDLQKSVVRALDVRERALAKAHQS